MESSSPSKRGKTYSEVFFPLPPLNRESSIIMYELRTIYRYMEEQFSSIIREQARQKGAIVPQYECVTLCLLDIPDDYVPLSPMYSPHSSEHSAKPFDKTGWMGKWMVFNYPYSPPDDLPRMKAQEEAPQPPPPPPPPSREFSMIMDELRRMRRYMKEQFTSIVPKKPQSEPSPPSPVYYTPSSKHSEKTGWMVSDCPPPDDPPLPQGGDDVQAKMDRMKAYKKAPLPPPPLPPPSSREFSMILDELRRMHRYMEGKFTSILREQARQRDAIVPKKPQSEPSDEYAPLSPVYYPPSSEHSAEPSDKTGWMVSDCPPPDDRPLPQGGVEVQAKMDRMKAQEEALQPPPPPSRESTIILDELRRIHRYMEGKFTSILREQARQRDSKWDDCGVVDKETHKRKNHHEGDVMEETCKKKAKFVEGSEEFGQFPADGKMINEVGHIGASLQEVGARLVSIGRTQELEKEQLAARVKELETKVSEAFGQGFYRAVTQVKAVFPEIDVDKLDVTKVVLDGKLVDEDATGEKND
ncbi:uncharacterized protein LOC107621249 isoform X1 [Arachis ipaensis]|uniref:uncharacterized protein LOC107621249 isoform X1 n=1 Tax=Arachis ipaensis TaxID=130454 RepID=UPI0007AF385D|nr:uncharacterized protein LOC107621249 isoform X1 [Arachis ipaensis]XP_025631345.1 uncharacterized protein LOC112726245 isoform X1 [Arachis hypogaea]QHO22150.1 uncharacterized protein DS421_12g352720 [Arachis hypogaea]